MWWGLFVGLVIGSLQLLAVNKLGKMILEGKVSAKVIGGILFLIKMAVIILILYLMSAVALSLVIWTAVGMLIGLTAASLFMYKRHGRT